jgi:2-polyprenyl-3-methyl-5-hydroxy-6-metoxy-1,4-benzoquinol methylase
LRIPSEREYIHERLGSRFRDALSEYDTSRRVSVLVDEFLTPGLVSGRRVLDVGAGFGFFSARLRQLGADVIATDIGENLLKHIRENVGCECQRVDALALLERFGPESFDIVVSSECIEHTPSPGRALAEMAAVLKPGGLISVSTPNWLWGPVVRAATMAGLRPFDGLENFSSFRSIRRVLEGQGVEIVREKGLHLFPFQLRAYQLSRWCDDHLQAVRYLMINLCVLGQKKKLP